MVDNQFCVFKGDLVIVDNDELRMWVKPLSNGISEVRMISNKTRNYEWIAAHEEDKMGIIGIGALGTIGGVCGIIYSSWFFISFVICIISIPLTAFGMWLEKSENKKREAMLVRLRNWNEDQELIENQKPNEDQKSLENKAK